jgi:hypothetical protein
MKKWLPACIALLGLVSCLQEKPEQDQHEQAYTDVPYLQDYSIKYDIADSGINLYKAYADRNGVIQVLSSKGLLHPFSGAMLYPGTLLPDDSYHPMKDKKISAMGIYRHQLVYLDDKAVLSNAWAGRVYIKHGLANASIFSGGSDFDFLVSDGSALQYLKDAQVLWEGKSTERVLDIISDSVKHRFLVLTPAQIFSFSPADKSSTSLFAADSLTCFSLSNGGKEIVVGTRNGYIVIDAVTGKQKGGVNRMLPSTELTAVAEIDGSLWFGSAKGAFMLKDDGKFNYYASKRWLPSDDVKHIAEGDGSSVLVLTGAGLGKISFMQMTLEEKAAFYDNQVRLRHMRYGLYCDVANLEDGDLSTATLRPRDSDNLWTAMYLGGQLFRYLVTHQAEAKQNCIESFEAMERLYTIHDIPGFFARSFERRGIMPFKNEYRPYLQHYWYPGYQNTISWRHAADTEWDWKGAPSSDQTVGQMFALTLLAQYMDDEGIKKRAIQLMDGLMSHIVDHQLRLVDHDGRATLWGIWHPEYVNRFPEMVGDRKLYSSNIIAFLQTAWHFTGKEKYRKVAEDLLYRHGYLKNLTRPFAAIGKAPPEADAWSRTLSAEWNHSDDEMYFLAYWGLYPYALDDSLKEQYRSAIRDHYEIKKPDKNALWNFCYALTGAGDFNLQESIWHLKEMPLDMIEWSMHNSHRADIRYMEENFRGQTTTEVLPPDERPEQKHNRNLFTLDVQHKGHSEQGAGDTYLLPYWMGRYLEVIRAPEKK